MMLQMRSGKDVVMPGTAHPRVAVEIGNALGPYGVPLTDLTRPKAAVVANQFLDIED